MKNLLIFVVIIFTNFLHAQHLADTIPICKNSLSIEFAGSSCNVLSVHYDRIIKKNKTSFYSTDFGIGYVPTFSRYNSNPVFGSSLALDWNSKLYMKNHFIGGIGVAYSDGLIQSGFENETKKSNKVLYGSLRLGYKFQKTTKGLFLRIMATPLFKVYEFTKLYWPAPSVLPFIGIGAGYSF